MTVSNFNYSMSVASRNRRTPADEIRPLPGGPPPVLRSGQHRRRGADDAVFTISGMDSAVLKTISANGQVLEGSRSLSLPTGRSSSPSTSTCLT